MKRFLKSSLSIFLAITIIFSSAIVGLNEIDFNGLFAVKANAAYSGTCGNNLTWILDEAGTLSIIGNGEMTNYSVMSPAQWYSYRTSIKKVIINSNVTSIGDYAFWNCTSLVSVTIPDSVTYIGAGAFSNTGYYNNIDNWENGVLYIGKHLIKAETSLSGEYEIISGTKTIAGHSFSGCTSLASVTIPDSVISIGEGAFWACKSLTSLTICDGVANIRDDAFHSCTGLTSITIPNSVTFIGDYAFYNCSGLTSFTIPNGVTSIGNYAFALCDSLKSIEIPDNVTVIGESAFYSCDSLTSVIIGVGVTSIGDEGFSNCSSLTSIEVDEDNINYSSIDGVLFNKDKTKLIQYPAGKTSTEYTIFNTVNAIPDKAFYNCDNLISITIPDGVTSIGNYAFQYCSRLTSVIIGNSLTSIGDEVFSNCSSLTSIDVDEDNVNYSSIDGVLFNKGKTELIKYPLCKTNTEYTIPDGVTNICDYAFEDCYRLTSITIGKSVTSIGYSAFYGCSMLVSMIIPDNVRHIGHWAFRHCVSLSSVIIGNGVTSIGDEAFYSCTNLNSVNIPDCVTNIGREALYDTAYYNNPDNWENGVLYIGNHLIKADNDILSGSYTVKEGTKTIADGAFNNCTSLVSIIIPNSVISIGYCAFYDCASLISITIPDSVTSIGSYAFEGCSNLDSVYITDIEAWCGIDFAGSSANPLSYSEKIYINEELITDVIIPESVTDIGAYAFYNCTALTSFTIPNNVTSIGDSAFSNCINLASLIIPNSVTDIGAWAFYGCEGITSIVIPNSITNISDSTFYGCTNLKSITIPNSVISIGEGAFWACHSLASISIPDSVTSIGEYAFQACTSLTSIIIPDGITNIGEHTFFWCTSLSSITIPSSVKSIGEDAFYNCYNLEYVFYTGSESEWVDITIDNNNEALINASIHYNSTDHTYEDKIDVEATCTDDGLMHSECIVCGYSLEAEEIPATGHTFNDGKCEDCGVDINLAFADMLIFTLSPFKDSYSVKAVNKEIRGDLIIPESYNGLPVASIDYLGFQNCSGLTSVIIPESVTSIGGCSFIGCTNLKSIYLPDSVEYIGENVFYDTAFYNDETNWENGVLYINNHLVEADCNVVNGEYAIKDGTITVASYALYGCNKLTTLILPDSLKNIGYEALLACKELSHIKVSENNDNFVCIDGVLYNGDCTEIVWYSLKNTQSDFEIVDTLKSLDFWVFYENNYLDKIIVSFNSQLSSISYSNDEVNQYELEYGCNNESLFSDIRVKNKIIIHDISSEWTIDKKATCTQTGVKSHHCNYCDLVTDETIISEHGHQSGDWIVEKEPTCTMNGIKMQYCVNCDEILNVETILSEGHTLSDWIIRKATVNGSGSKHKECTQCKLILETETIPQLKCSKAKLSKISNTASGVKITWGKVTGADSYRVYRKTKGGSWNNIGSIGKTEFIDKTAKSGATYYYAVKVRNEAGDTDYSNSLSIKRLSVPKLSTVANTSSGVKVSWKKVTGASGYIVYRKTKSGDWKEIGKTKKLYYTDKKAKSGTSYYYSVRAYSGSVKSYYNTDGLSIRRLVAPKISSATSKREGILLKWNKITGASGYYVYRKASSGEWKKIATVKGKTKIKYLDETPRKGATYQYRVKAYYSKSTSYNSNTYKIKCKY